MRNQLRLTGVSVNRTKCIRGYTAIDLGSGGSRGSDFYSGGNENDGSSSGCGKIHVHVLVLTNLPTGTQ